MNQQLSPLEKIAFESDLLSSLWSVKPSAHLIHHLKQQLQEVETAWCRGHIIVNDRNEKTNIAMLISDAIACGVLGFHDPKESDHFHCIVNWQFDPAPKCQELSALFEIWINASSDIGSLPNSLFYPYFLRRGGFQLLSANHVRPRFYIELEDVLKTE